MTAQRKHRDAYSPSYAMDYIMSHVGTMFDKEVVDVFSREFPIYPTGFIFKSSNGKYGVFAGNESNSIRPKIQLADGIDVDLALAPEYRSVLLEEMM